MKYKNNYLLYSVFMILIIYCLCGTACKKDSIYHDYNNTDKVFDGTALKYLEEQKGTFDSLLLVLNRLPDLKDTLANAKITFFAISNSSFEVAIKNLNLERKVQNKPPLYLSTVPANQLDTLLCRYIIRGLSTTDDYKPFATGISVISVKNNYGMHVQYKKLDASGFVGGGPQSLIYTDPKKSIFQKFWERSSTKAVNIKTNNGIINILESNHDFGFNEFAKRTNL